MNDSGSIRTWVSGNRMAVGSGTRVRPAGVTVLAAAAGGALIAAALAILVIVAPGLAMPVGVLLSVSLAAGALAQVTRAERRRRDREAKIDSDLAVLSERLLRLEAGGADDARPAEWHRIAELASGTAADVEQLGGLIQQLAEAVEGRDQTPAPSIIPDFDRTSIPPPPTTNVSASVPTAKAIDLSTREDFARAATAILRRLGHAPEAPLSVPQTDDAITDALKQGRIELHLQPVVTLPQRRTRYYDATPRLKLADGTVLEPSGFRSRFLASGLLPDLDLVVLERALAIARHLAGQPGDAAVACHVSRETLRRRDVLPRFEERLEAERRTTRRLVLSVSHDDLVGLGSGEGAALARFAGLGASLAVEGLPDLRADWVGLVRRGFDYAKVDAAQILAARLPGDTSELVREAGASGILLIATHVLREEFVPDLLDYDVPLAQGNAIAAPRPLRIEAMAEPREPPIPARPEPDPPGPVPPADGRASFRDYLRRAG